MNWTSIFLFFFFFFYYPAGAKETHNLLERTYLSAANQNYCVGHFAWSSALFAPSGRNDQSHMDPHWLQRVSQKLTSPHCHISLVFLPGLHCHAETWKCSSCTEACTPGKTGHRGYTGQNCDSRGHTLGYEFSVLAWRNPLRSCHFRSLLPTRSCTESNWPVQMVSCGQWVACPPKDTLRA